DLLASIVTAYDAKKLGEIPTRPVRSSGSHTERRVVTQTAYGLQMVGGLQAVRIGPGGGGGAGGDLVRALAYMLSNQSPAAPAVIPIVHVQALGSPHRKGQGSKPEKIGYPLV
ncbi:MAG: hypothetical protein AAB277_04425, partial [Planctomycetota bacterium]